MIETTNKTKLFGILGTPVAHTLSPAMHSFMAEQNKIDMAYLAFDVPPEKLGDPMRGVKAIGACGFNITAPHKICVMDYLDHICPEAQHMNSVNTVVNRNGVWHGFNTDGNGYCESLLLEGHEIKNKNILMMGAGGSARSLAFTLAKSGAKSISITSRSMEKIHIIGEMVEHYTETIFYDTLDKAKDYDIVINTTPVGMHGAGDSGNPCGFMDLIHENMVCSDIIYNPKETVFLKEAKKRGARIHNGLGMLVLQGILAFELFCEISLDHKRTYEQLMHLFDYYRI